MPDPQTPEHPLPPLGDSAPLVPPLYQSSVYTLPDLDALDRIMNGEEPGFIYARDAHPNARHLAEPARRRWKAATWAVMCGSGMAAISAILLATLQQGDRIVASNRLYGRTTQLLDAGAGALRRPDGVRRFQRPGRRCGQALDQPHAMLFVETMSNPLLRLVDSAALASWPRSTAACWWWTTPSPRRCWYRPLDLGADLVMESLTKMIGGHSDVTLGAAVRPRRTADRR